MNDRDYRRNRAAGQVHRDKERASRSSQLIGRKATADKRESHSNLTDRLAVPLRAVSVSDVPGQNIPLNQADRGRQVDLVTWEATLVGGRFRPLDGSSWQLAERIETAELQAAVIAEKLMQPGDPKNDQRFFVAALDARTFASRAPHNSHLKSIRFGFWWAGASEKPLAGQEQLSK